MEPKNKKQETIFAGHADAVNCIALTSDSGYIVSGSDDCTIKIWNIHEKIQEAIFKSHTRGVNQY